MCRSTRDYVFGAGMLAILGASGIAIASSLKPQASSLKPVDHSLAANSTLSRPPGQDKEHDFGIRLYRTGEVLEHTFVMPVPINGSEAFTIGRIENGKPCCLTCDAKIHSNGRCPQLRVMLKYRVGMPGEVAWAIRIIPKSRSLPAIVFRATANLLPRAVWATDLSPQRLKVGKSTRLSTSLVRHLPSNESEPPIPNVRATGPVRVELFKPTLDKADHIPGFNRWIFPAIIEYASAMSLGVDGAQIEVIANDPLAGVVTRLEWIVESPIEWTPSAVVFRQAGPEKAIVVLKAVDGQSFHMQPTRTTQWADMQLTPAPGTEAHEHRLSVSPKNKCGSQSCVQTAVLNTSLGEVAVPVVFINDKSSTNTGQ